MKTLLFLFGLFLFSCQESPTENSTIPGSRNVDATTQASSMECYSPAQSYEQAKSDVAVVDTHRVE